MENRYFGQNLAKLRKERQLSQNDLANNVNVTISAISKWENNKNMPDIDMLKTLSKFFGVPLDELLRSPEDDFQPEIKPEEAEPDILESALVIPDAESPAQKKISKPLLITAIVVLIMIMLAMAIGIYTKANQQPAMPFRIMNSRTVEDEVWGTTTEIGVYCEDKINNYVMDLVSGYVESEWLNNGNYGGDTVDTIIIYFYNDKALAAEIVPEATSYLFLINPKNLSE